MRIKLGQYFPEIKVGFETSVHWKTRKNNRFFVIKPGHILFYKRKPDNF